jgi:flagellar hook protein FlgE
MSLTLASANGATNPINAAMSFSSVTQIAGTAGETSVMATSQDGRALGTLSDFAIGKDGVITGTFTNGMTEPLAQLCLAGFANPAGLNKVGTSVLAETGNSGLPQIGQPASGSMGSVTSGFLEASNVDLATEFANMIFAQRGFQANARIITTSDQILQELVQLKQ